MANSERHQYTINQALSDAHVIEQLDSCKTSKEISELVSKACENITGDKTTLKRDNLIKDIERSSLFKAKQLVVNFYLKGDGLGVI